MNYKQKGYNCNSCLNLFPTSEVKQYCLDNGLLNIRMECVLCSPCYHRQSWSKEKLGYFPLLSTLGLTKNTEIKTPEFTRHEEDEKRVQQERETSLFNCDCCSQWIPLGEEKSYEVCSFKINTFNVYRVKYFIFCPSCFNNSYRQPLRNAIFNWEEIKIEKSPTLLKYEKWKRELRGQNTPLEKWEKQVEEERQAKMKKAQEEWGF